MNGKSSLNIESFLNNTSLKWIQSLNSIETMGKRNKIKKSKTIYVKSDEDKLNLWTQFYHLTLRSSWLIFMVGNALLYMLINLIFALIYWSISDYGVHPPLEYSPFFSSLLLSVQTLTTVGYGTYGPTTLEGHWVMMIESWVGFASPIYCISFGGRICAITVLKVSTMLKFFVPVMWFFSLFASNLGAIPKF